MRTWKLGVGGALMLLGATQCVFPAYELEESADSTDGGGATSGGGNDSGVGGAGGAGAETNDDTTQCEAGDRRCLADGVTPQECDAAGTWQDLDPCPAVCTNGQCEDSCEDNSKQCASGDLLVCTGGVWETEESCEFVCDSEASPPACSGECVPNDTACATDAEIVQQCGADGFWTDNEACPNVCLESEESAACVQCSPGSTECQDGRVATCDAAGAWQTSTECGSDQICRDGGCVQNDPYNVGWSDSSDSTDWSAFGPEDDRWYVIPIEVPTTARVEALRLNGAAAGGAQARLALWEDDGGKPGAFVAQTDELNMALGVVSGAPVPLATQVTGGNTYWVGAKFTGSAETYQAAESGSTLHTYDQAFGTNPATSLDPFPSGSSSTFTNTKLPFYLLVKDLQ